jgi:hypothetical protein
MGENDSEINHCGINLAHAYSILSVFTIQLDGTTEDLLMMRNPWGRTGYNQ